MKSVSRVLEWKLARVTVAMRDSARKTSTDHLLAFEAWRPGCQADLKVVVDRPPEATAEQVRPKAISHLNSFHMR